jgi:uncharacterized SAM-binding protein YcdF (DUF218 family)
MTLSSRRRRRRGRWLRLGFVLVVAVAVWALGLFRFAAQIPPAGEDDRTSTDAIVVLTGGSDRLREGLKLLAERRGQALLISGVPAGVGLDDLLAGLTEPPPTLPSNVMAACCIVVGHRAGNTAGNAQEAESWMRSRNFRSLRLVTADYHMPRSLLEFERVMPDIAILPHPVFPAGVRRGTWWLSPRTVGLFVNEYNKLLIALARGWVSDGLAVVANVIY